MSKVKCKMCANITGTFCSIKKVSIHPNKKRDCKAFIYDEHKVMPKKEINVIKVGYAEMERAKARRKAELKELRRSMKQKPNQGTAKQLGLLETPLNLPRTDTKHPLTGDLSRFISTAAKNEE